MSTTVTVSPKYQVVISIGAHDLLIAATALYHQRSVATRDLRSFDRVDGLAVDIWS